MVRFQQKYYSWISFSLSLVRAAYIYAQQQALLIELVWSERNCRHFMIVCLIVALLRHIKLSEYHPTEASEWVSERAVEETNNNNTQAVKFYDSFLGTV